MSPLEKQLRTRIEQDGPISVADYMAACNAHYYATRDPLGAGGDFITAPEISQMFGELVGAWLTDLWVRAGEPDVAYVELGPGRGTLAADALRAMEKAGLRPPVHFVETSPVLREAQAARVPAATWHDDDKTLPSDRPLLIVANEFFDALPLEQYRADGEPVLIGLRDGKFVRLDGVAYEASYSPEYYLACRLRDQGGAALIIDYGYTRPRQGQPGYFEFRNGDTLQAVSRHGFADPFEQPGECDLTAHVDFVLLEESAAEADLSTYGTVEQGHWLTSLGINERAAALTRAAPERAEEIEAARERLTGPDQMGRLFKVLAMTAKGWPEPAGFAA